MKAMKQVLVIESDVSTARLMGWILAEAGYGVDTVARVEDGVRRLEQDPPDVVVFSSPCSLSETTRWIERMHAKARRTAFVDMVQAARRGGHPAEGAAGVLVAPFDADTLVRAVHDAEPPESPASPGNPGPPPRLNRNRPSHQTHTPAFWVLRLSMRPPPVFRASHVK